MRAPQRNGAVKGARFSVLGLAQACVTLVPAMASATFASTAGPNRRVFRPTPACVAYRIAIAAVAALASYFCLTCAKKTPSPFAVYANAALIALAALYAIDSLCARLNADDDAIEIRSLTGLDIVWIGSEAEARARMPREIENWRQTLTFRGGDSEFPRWLANLWLGVMFLLVIALVSAFEDGHGSAIYALFLTAPVLFTGALHRLHAFDRDSPFLTRLTGGAGRKLGLVFLALAAVANYFPFVLPNDAQTLRLALEAEAVVLAAIWIAVAIFTRSATGVVVLAGFSGPLYLFGAVPGQCRIRPSAGRAYHRARDIQTC